MDSGIYKLQSKIAPDKFYIFGAIDIDHFLQSMVILLKAKKYPVKRLQDHVDKYGFEDLVCSEILSCFKRDNIPMKEKYIKTLKPWFNGIDEKKIKDPSKKAKK